MTGAIAICWPNVAASATADRFPSIAQLVHEVPSEGGRA
jgi:hypothetical protein